MKNERVSGEKGRGNENTSFPLSTLKRRHPIGLESALPGKKSALPHMNVRDIIRHPQASARKDGCTFNRKVALRQMRVWAKGTENKELFSIGRTIIQ